MGSKEAPFLSVKSHGWGCRVIRGSAGDRFLSGRHLFLPTGSFIGYPTGYTTIIIITALIIIIVIVNIIVITVIIMITITQVIYRLSHRAHCQQSAEYAPPHKDAVNPNSPATSQPHFFCLGNSWPIFFWYLSTLISLEIVNPQFFLVFLTPIVKPYSEPQFFWKFSKIPKELINKKTSEPQFFWKLSDKTI